MRLPDGSELKADLSKAAPPTGGEQGRIANQLQSAVQRAMGLKGIGDASADSLRGSAKQQPVGLAGGGILNKVLDWLQSSLDVAGLPDPTGLIDASNAGISLFRAATTKDDSRRREHIANAGISAVSAIPGKVGSVAKLLKTRQYGRVMETVAESGAAQHIAGFAAGGVQKLFQWNAGREVSRAIDAPNGASDAASLDKYVAGYTETIQADDKTGRMAIPAKIFEIRDNKASVGWANGSAADVVMPVESLPHFFADLSGKVNLPANSGHPVIDAIASGQGEYLGKGQDGVVFGVGDKVAKMSTTVPYQPFNSGHRTPQEAKDLLRAEVERNNKLFVQLGGKGILPQEYREHGDKAFAIRDRLTLPKDGQFTAKQVGQIRQTMDAMHDTGYVLGDTIQVGTKGDKPYLFDLGQARDVSNDPPTWQKDYFDNDSSAFGRFAAKAGYPELAKPLAKTAGIRFGDAIEGLQHLVDNPDDLDFIRQCYGESLNEAADGLKLSGRFTKQQAKEYRHAETLGVTQGFASGAKAMQAVDPLGFALGGQPSGIVNAVGLAGGGSSAGSLGVANSPTDTVPAVLAPGEVVLNKAQQQRLESNTGTSASKLFGDAGVPGFSGGGEPGKEPWRLAWDKTDISQERIPPGIDERFTESVRGHSDEQLKATIAAQEKQSQSGGLLDSTREHRREILEAELRRRLEASQPEAKSPMPSVPTFAGRATIDVATERSIDLGKQSEGFSLEEAKPSGFAKRATPHEIITHQGGISLDIPQHGDADILSKFAEADQRSRRREEILIERNDRLAEFANNPGSPDIGKELSRKAENSKMRMLRSWNRRNDTLPPEWDHELPGQSGFGEALAPSPVSGSPFSAPAAMSPDAKATTDSAAKQKEAAEVTKSAAEKLADSVKVVTERSAAGTPVVGAAKSPEQLEQEHVDAKAKYDAAHAKYFATPPRQREEIDREEIDRLGKAVDAAHAAKTETPSQMFARMAAKPISPTPSPAGAAATQSAAQSATQSATADAATSESAEAPKSPSFTRRSTRDRLRSTLTGRAVRLGLKASRFIGQSRMGRAVANSSLGKQFSPTLKPLARIARTKLIQAAGSVGGRIAINSTIGGIVGGPLGGAGGTIGTLAGGAGGAAIGATAATVGFVMALNDASKALGRFGQELNESNRKYATYNGSIAMAFAKLDIARLQRDIQTGRATQGSAVALANSVNRFEKAGQPLREAGGTALNIVGTGLTEIATRMTELVTITADVFGVLSGIKEWGKFLFGDAAKEAHPNQKAAAAMLGVGLVPGDANVGGKAPQQNQPVNVGKLLEPFLNVFAPAGLPGLGMAPQVGQQLLGRQQQQEREQGKVKPLPKIK